MVGSERATRRKLPSKSLIDISRLPIGESPGVNSGGHAGPENKRAKRPRRSLLLPRYSADFFIFSLSLLLYRVCGKIFSESYLLPNARAREREREFGCEVVVREINRGNCEKFLQFPSTIRVEKFHRQCVYQRFSIMLIIIGSYIQEKMWRCKSITDGRY